MGSAYSAPKGGRKDTTMAEMMKVPTNMEMLKSQIETRMKAFNEATRPIPRDDHYEYAVRHLWDNLHSAKLNSRQAVYNLRVNDLTKMYLVVFGAVVNVIIAIWFIYEVSKEKKWENGGKASIAANVIGCFFAFAPYVCFRWLISCPWGRKKWEVRCARVSFIIACFGWAVIMITGFVWTGSKLPQLVHKELESLQ